ncbi:MAG: glycosyltransferase [Pseudomonadota bacterium]
MNNNLDQKKPWLSVVLPAFNEEKYIADCITSILSLNLLDDEYEVIVVDNNSTDNTASIVKQFDRVKYRHLETGNVGAVRNFGAREAKGNYLAFIDADCIVKPTWGPKAKSLIRDNTNTTYGGSCHARQTAGWIEKYWLLTRNTLPTLPKHLIGASILIPKSIFFKVGGFNEIVTSGEDTELSISIQRMGNSVILTHDLDVLHLGNAKTLKDFFWRQVWQSENYLKSPAESLRDPIFFLALIFLTTLIGTCYLLSESLILSFLLLMSALVMPLVLSVKRAYRAKLGLLFFLKSLPAIYILDLVYLSGRSAGLIKSIIIWRPN